MNKDLQNKIRIHFLSSTLPALIFGGISGILAGLVITLYKFFAKEPLPFRKGFFFF